MTSSIPTSSTPSSLPCTQSSIQLALTSSPLTEIELKGRGKRELSINANTQILNCLVDHDVGCQRTQRPEHQAKAVSGKSWNRENGQQLWFGVDLQVSVGTLQNNGGEQNNSTPHHWNGRVSSASNKIVCGVHSAGRGGNKKRAFFPL